MSWPKKQLRDPAFHIERAKHWYDELIALPHTVQATNYHEIAYVECGMAIDTLPAGKVDATLKAVREEIWEYWKSKMPLPELINRIKQAAA